jgi:hypothetical protein
MPGNTPFTPDQRSNRFEIVICPAEELHRMTGLSASAYGFLTCHDHSAVDLSGSAQVSGPSRP